MSTDEPIKVPLRSARLFVSLRAAGNTCDVVYGVANCGDLRIEVEVPYDEWPVGADGYGLASKTEVELT